MRLIFKNNPENVSFLAAPIKSDTDVLGVVSVYFVHKKYIDLKTYLDFFASSCIRNLSSDSDSKTDRRGKKGDFERERSSQKRIKE